MLQIGQYPSFHLTFYSLYIATAAILRIVKPRKHGSISGRVKQFSLLCGVNTGSGVNQASHSMLFVAFFRDVNSPARPSDYSYLSSAEEKNTESYISIHLYNFLLGTETGL